MTRARAGVPPPLAPSNPSVMPVMSVLPAAPAMLASGAIMLVLLGWAGAWTGVLVLLWIVAGLGIATGRGEALVIRCRGCRRPSIGEAAVIGQPWAAALRRCKLCPDDYRLHVRVEPRSNAFAVGRHSVIVTTGLLRLAWSQRLTPAMAEAVLVHELGHLVTGSTRYGLATHWFAAPGRVACRVALALSPAGRRRGLRFVAVAITVTAAAQSARDGDYATAALFSAWLALGAIAPLAEAAVSRRSEMFADNYAVAVGVGTSLADALHQIDAPHARHLPPVAPPRTRHMATADRIASLGAVAHRPPELAGGNAAPCPSSPTSS